MAFKDIQWRRVYRQFIAAATASLAALCAGCCVAWISPTLPRLTEQTSLVLSTVEKSWVGSLLSLASAVGPALSMFLMHHFGCRVTLFTIAAVYVCGWVIVAAMQSVAMLMAGRFILGLAMGASFAVLPTYTGEIAQAEVRGVLSSLFPLFMASGMMLEYIVGPYVSYLSLAIFSCAFPLVLLVGMIFMPESPYQLVARGKMEDARASLQWLMNTSGEEVDAELETIKVNVKFLVESKSKSSFKDLVARRGNIKALVLCLALSVFQQVTGSAAIAAYTETIFLQSDAKISATLSTIINGVVMVVATVVSCGLIDFVGRRPLAFVSTAGVVLSQIPLGTYYYFSNTRDVSNFGWLPITCVILFTVSYSIGWGTLPTTVAAEVFASEVKGKAMFLTMATLNFAAFLNVQFFLEASEKLGMWWCFWFFGACTFLAGVLSYFFMPETKGRSFEQIQRIFHDRIYV